MCIIHNIFIRHFHIKIIHEIKEIPYIKMRGKHIRFGDLSKLKGINTFGFLYRISNRSYIHKTIAKLFIRLGEKITPKNIREGFSTKRFK